MKKNNNILDNWIFVSSIGSIIGFLLALLLVRNWKIALIVAIIVFIIIISFNPKRRYIKAFYFVLALFLTLNKFFFELVGHISGIDFKMGTDKMNTATNIAFIFLAGMTLYLDYKERNNLNGVTPKNNLKDFIHKDGYISEPRYILSDLSSGMDDLMETKKELQSTIENYKFQVIEHQAEVRKLKVSIKRFEEELDFVNEEIESLKDKNREEQ